LLWPLAVSQNRYVVQTAAFPFRRLSWSRGFETQTRGVAHARRFAPPVDDDDDDDESTASAAAVAIVRVLLFYHARAPNRTRQSCVRRPRRRHAVIWSPPPPPQPSFSSVVDHAIVVITLDGRSGYIYDYRPSIALTLYGYIIRLLPCPLSRPTDHGRRLADAGDASVDDKFLSAWRTQVSVSRTRVNTYFVVTWHCFGGFSVCF